MPVKDWLWKIDIDAMVGRNCFIETLEGVRREGKITGVKVHEMKIKDTRRGLETVRIPMHVELNGDVTDMIEFMRMERFELR